MIFLLLADLLAFGPFDLSTVQAMSSFVSCCNLRR